jgi:hypothetical protein
LTESRQDAGSSVGWTLERPAQVLDVPVTSLLPRRLRWDEILPAQTRDLIGAESPDATGGPAWVRIRTSLTNASGVVPIESASLRSVRADLLFPEKNRSSDDWLIVRLFALSFE